MNKYVMKYGVPFAIALVAIYVANNVPQVQKVVATKS